MAKKQYLQLVQAEYLGSSKTHKGMLLDEAHKRTRLGRKYLIHKLSAKTDWTPRQRKRRSVTYDGRVIAALVRVWEIFDYPCGQRLEPILPEQVEPLRIKGELRCDSETATKLTRMRSATIDRLLRHEKQVRHLARTRNPGMNRLLFHRIPVKLSDEWNRNELGNEQLDYVAHCGSSAQGHFAYTVSAADIASGWWEGQAILGRSQEATHQALKAIRTRLPFTIREVHPDNDSGIINYLICNWCEQNGIQMSRSRPCKKNDNAWVEQRNWTHVRKVVGYLRYDTPEEVVVMNQLYRDFCLYRNFFLPTIKLVSKIREGGSIKRRYDQAKTPYQRIMASGQLTRATKQKLERLYRSLNPAELKRKIDQHRKDLLQCYDRKPGLVRTFPAKKTHPHMVRNYMIQPVCVRSGS